MGRVPLTQWLSRPPVAEWQAPSIFSIEAYARYVTSRARIFTEAISTRRVFQAICLTFKAAFVCVRVYAQGWLMLMSRLFTGDMHRNLYVVTRRVRGKRIVFTAPRSSDRA